MNSEWLSGRFLFYVCIRERKNSQRHLDESKAERERSKLSMASRVDLATRRGWGGERAYQERKTGEESECRAFARE